MKIQAVFVFLLLVLPSLARPEAVVFSPFYQTEFTDNIDQQPINETDGFINTVGIRASKAYREGDLEADLAGILGYRAFDGDDSFDEEIVGFSGTAEWKIIPERFSVVVADYLSQVPVDRFVTSNVGNQQTTNVFLISPTFQARVNARHDFFLSAGTAYVYDEETESDRAKFSISPQWRFKYSNLTNIHFIYEFSELQFLEDAIPDEADYQRNDGLMRIENLHRRYQITLDLGISEIKFADNDSEVGTLGRFSWDFNSRQGLFSLFISSEYGDLINDFERNSSVINSLQEQVTDVQLFTRDRIELAYAHEVYKANFRLRSLVELIDRFEINEEEFATDFAFEINRTIADMDFIKGFLNVGSIISYRRTEFNDRVDTNEEFDAGLQLSFIFSKNFALRGELRHINSNSTDPTQSYEENIIAISIGYNNSDNSNTYRRY